jgi:SLT domain-containing protein/phage-related protein
MATITSLDFNISSNWDGGGVRQARNDLDELSADLRRIADTRATAQVGVDINRSDLDAVRSELDQIGAMRETATVSVRVDRAGLDELRSDLDQVGRMRAEATAGVRVDSSGLRQLTNELDQVARTRATATANVNVNDANLSRVVADLHAFDGRRATATANVNVNDGNLTALSARLREFDGRHFTAHADVDTDTAGAHLHSLSGEADRAASSLLGVGNGSSGASRGIGSVGSSAGSASPLMGNFAIVIGVVVAALMLIGPASALAAAAIIGTLGGAVIGLGALALSGTAQVKSAFSSLTSSVKSEMTQAAQVMKGPLVQAMGEIQRGLKQLQPAFTQAFAAAAPLIKPVADALLNFTRSVMPGVITALRAAQPVFDALSKGATALGKGVSAMFAGVAAGAKGAGSALQTLMSGAGTILAQLGQAFGQMAAAGSRAFSGLMTGLTALVGGAMKGFVGAVKAMDGSLGPFLATLGRVVGDILAKMLPVFGKVISVLMTGLMPVLKAVEPALVTMGQALGTAIVSALRVVTPLLGSLAKTFAQVMIAITPLIPPLTKIMIAGLQLMVAVITPLLPLITLLAKGLGALAPVINAAATVITLLSRGIQDAIKWITNWQNVTNAFSIAWNAVWNALKIATLAVWDALKTAWNATLNGIITAWNTIGNALSIAWGAVWNAMKVAATAVWNALTVAWNAFVNGMNTIWNTVSSAMKAAWSAFWNALQTAANAVWNAMKAAWQATMNALSTTLTTVGNAMKTAWSAVWNAMKTAAEAVWNAMKTAWSAAINAIKTTMTTVTNAMKSAWSAAWNAMKTAAEGVWNALKTAWSATTNTLKSVLNSFGSAAKSAWSGIWNTIKSTASTVWGGIKHVVADGVNGVIGIINGIIGAWDTIVNAVGLKKLNIGKITYHANFAEGGPVHGPGTGTSDDIPARLSNGEHVWTAAEVSAAGGHGAVAAMRSRALGGKAVRTMGAGRGWSGFAFAAGGGVDPDTPKGATAAQKAAAGVPYVYLKGNEQRIGEDQYNKLSQVQKDIVDAAGVHKVGKGVLDTIVGGLKGIAKGAIGGLGDIVKLGASALGFIGKEVIDHIFAPLIKPLTGDMGAGVIGEFAVDESKNIVTSMVDLLVKKDSEAGSVGGKIPEGMHKEIIDKALAAAGVPPPGSLAEWEAGLNTLIQRESGWNAGAVNHWDSNAAAGHPSGGLAQVIGPTFAAYHVAGTSTNPLDPIANVAAAINYIVHRYGNISRVQQANANLPPKGYASGTNSASSGLALVGEQGPEIINFGGGEQVIPNGQTQDILSGSQLSTDWNSSWQDALTIMNGATDAMQSNGAQFMSNLRRVFSDQSAVLSNQWQKDWESNKTVATTSWDTTTNQGNSFTDTLKKTFSDTSTQMQSDWQKSLDTNTAETAKYWTDTEGKFTDGSTWFTQTFFPPVNDFLTKTFPQSFTTGAASVATGWNGIKQEVYDPVKAIVDTVYNSGIRGVWNVIANAFGAKTLDEFTMPAFATGGAVHGPGSGTSDSITARLSNGEHVWTAREVTAAGGHGAVASLRSQVMGGGPVRKMGSTAFAAGGGVSTDPTQATGSGTQGVAGTAGKDLASLTLGTIAPVANPMLDAIAKSGKDTVDGMIPGTPDLESGMNGMIDQAIGDIEAWITAHDISPTMGGANDAAAQAWADSQVGKPYALGGDFVNNIDCSEYQSGIARAILGQTPAPWFTTFAFSGSSAPTGFEENLTAPYMVGITNVGVGHMAGTLNGKNYEATPPAVRSGPSARGYDDGMFTNRYGFRPSIESAIGAVTDSNHLAIIDAALAAAGVPPPGDQGSWEAGMNLIITNESGWNPNAINNYDINAQNGVPSQGLAQVIPPTFSAYHVAGTSNNILDPIANVAAAINYIVHTYGNINNVPGVASVNAGGGYLPYWNGTKSAHGGWAMVGERGPEMMNLGGGGQQIRSFKDSLHDMRDSWHRGGSGEDNSVTVHMGDGAVQININGKCDEETVKQLRSPEFMDELSNAIIAGVGRKNG